LLAGDYTDTGLPATIEGAIRSGFAAAELMLDPGRWTPLRETAKGRRFPAAARVKARQERQPDFR